MGNPHHGNFHFYSDGFIQLKRRGHLLLLVRGLETLYYAALSQSWYENKRSDYYWQECNRAIQEVIDDKLAEFRLAKRARRNGYVSEEE